MIHFSLQLSFILSLAHVFGKAGADPIQVSVPLTPPAGVSPPIDPTYASIAFEESTLYLGVGS
jgi:hypothetical protein